MFALGEPLVRLETLRRQRGLTREKLAATAGVSVKTLYTLETSPEPRPTVQPRVMHGIAAALGVEPADVDQFRPALGLPPVS